MSPSNKNKSDYILIHSILIANLILKNGRDVILLSILIIVKLKGVSLSKIMLKCLQMT